MATARPFKPALLVIDMQEDFCPPNGSLAVAGGRDLATGINRLLKLPFAMKVATADWHPRDHASFACNHEGPYNEPFKHTALMVNPANPVETKTSTLWPPHCIQDTAGAALISELDASRFDTIVRKGMDARVEMYSVFGDIFGNCSGASHNCANLLRERGITHVYTCGLTGDVCVYQSSLGARKEGFEVVMMQDLTRSVNEASFLTALKELNEKGVVVAQSTGPEVLRVESLV